MKKDIGSDLSQKINSILFEAIVYKNGKALSGFKIEDNYPYEKNIIEYMKSCEHGLRPFLRVKDELSNEFIPGLPTCYYDDVLKWSSRVPYYMEKYNIRLPEEYENHFLQKIGIK